jgi:phage terminase large subunit-like protein
MSTLSPKELERAKSLTGWLASLDPSEQMATVEEMTPQERTALAELLHDWTLFARPEQLEPPGDWWICLFQTGRAWGKSRTIFELARQRIDAGVWRTVLAAGPTWQDTMDTIVNGSERAPGLLSLWPEHKKPALRMSKDDPHLRTWNGAKIRLRAAHQAERFRGPNNDGAILDELDAWKPERMSAAQAFALAEFSVRTGEDPRLFCASTPKRGRLVAQLRERPDVHVVRGSIHDNLANLHPKAVEMLESQYGKTRLGRQELEGELLAETEGAIVNHEMIDANRVSEPAELTRVVVGVDPSGTKHGDTQGIVAKGKGVDGHGYTLADRSCNLSPDGWGRRAVSTYHELDADCMVVEVNYGGDMCEAVIVAIDPSVRIKKVNATRGKHVRFEPLGGRYERGEEHHVGTFEALEDEVCAFTPDGFDGDQSPGRADAAVWATAELFPAHGGISPSDLYGGNGEDRAEVRE